MASSVWRFGVLGPLVVEHDGATVSLPGGHQRSLLALLLMADGAPLNRDRLIQELWGERPPASAVSALHVHLSKLRAALRGLLATAAGGYALGPGYELDVRRFEALVEEAGTAPHRAGSLLSEALDLFRGEPLCDIPSEGSIALWRRSLEDKRLRAQLAHVDARLAAGAGAELIAELEQLVVEHSFEERAWAQLMVALYRSGRQADSLEAYQRARRVFAAELGLAPGPALEEFQRRILDRDPDLLAPPARTASVPAAPPRSNLPQPLTKLIGREQALAELDGLAADPDVRLLTIAGPGGVGKTRILLELARRLEPRYADGAVLVLLEGLTDPALVPAEIAGAVARRDGTDGPSADGLAGHLQERELLVAIDNFEHLMPAAVAVSELLASSPRTRVLVSSRVPLRMRGEHTFELEPLEPPAAGSDPAQSPAVQLFLRCATAAGSRLSPDAELIETVAEICRALDGLPLAIELAASRCRSLTPAEIAGQLKEPLAIGEHGLRDLPDRQQTLQATMRWSYDLLTPPAREVLMAAGVFRGGFEQDALAAVVGRPLGAEVEELRDAGLARSEPDSRRYELLELVRAFALELVEASGQGPAARARHGRHFAAGVRSTAERFDAGEAPGELARPLLPDHANLRAALADAIERDDAATATGLALGLRPLWLTFMVRQEAHEFIERLLHRFTIPGSEEVALLKTAAFVDFRPSAKARYERLAARAAEIGDGEAVALATMNLFGNALNTRDIAAIRRMRPALLAQLTPDASDKALGWTRYFLGMDAYVDDRFDESVEHFTIGAQKAQAIGHDFLYASAIATRLLAQSARDGVIVQRDLAEVIEPMRGAGVQPLTAFALWLIARYAAGVAPDEAGRCLAHADRIERGLDAQLWPENELRDETMVVLGLDDLAELTASAPPVDHVLALDEAAAWLAARDPAETAPRTGARTLASARG